jgi:hypothetical protein
MNIFEKVKRGWNAFNGRDPTHMRIPSGVEVSSFRPDKQRGVFFYNDKTFISSIKNRIAMDVAQVTLMGNDLQALPEAFRLSQRTVSMIRQNLFWAFIYNVVCIPLAAGLPFALGCHWQITPVWASALMAMSSVSVVLNSLRLRYNHN